MVPFLSALIPFAILLWRGMAWVWAGFFILGLVMSVHETLLRAVVADLVPARHRGRYFGLFHCVYGFGMFTGGVLGGWLYGISTGLLSGVLLIIQLTAGSFLIIFRSRWLKGPQES